MEYPYVENYPPLKEWLDKHEARCMWQIASQPEWRENGLDYPQFYVECWIFPASKRLAVITVHSRRMGWEIYSSQDLNKIDDALADAETRLGLVK